MVAVVVIVVELMKAPAVEIVADGCALVIEEHADDGRLRLLPLEGRRTVSNCKPAEIIS